MTTLRRVRTWWEGLTPRWRGVLTWFLPLLIAHVFIGIAYWFNTTHGQSLARDSWTVRMAGATEVLCVLVMLIGARRWTTVTLGMTLFFVANAPVLLRVLGGVGDRPASDGWELNLIRSYYQVGSPMLLVGLLLWAVWTKFGEKEDVLTKPSGPSITAIVKENQLVRDENEALRAACVAHGIVVEPLAVWDGKSNRRIGPAERRVGA